MVKGNVAKFLVVGLLALSLLAIPLVGACAKPAPPAPTPAPAPAPAPAPLPEKLHWDLSLWSPAKALNYPIEVWVQDMADKTGGRWEIEIHGGGVLAPAKDTIDGIKAGMFQAGLVSSMYIPGKIPLRTVTENPFLAPSDFAEAGKWAQEMSKHPAIVKQVDDWNAMTLFAYAVGPYEYMGKKPFKKVEDLKGMRLRIDPISGAPLEAFGAVPNMIPGPEIYTALERGLLDGVMFVWPYTFGIYKLNELSQYVTLGIGLKIADMWLAVNKDDWNALPDEWKKLAEESAAQTIERYVAYREQFDAKWLKMFDEQGLDIITLAPEERAKLVAKAEPSWEEWIKEVEGKGHPGREVFDFAMAKRDEIVGK